MLSVKNKHERDENIEFDEPTHTYTICGDSDYTSVTTWIHRFFPHFDPDRIIGKMRSGKNWGPDNKYYGMTTAEIKREWKEAGKEARELGTLMHLNIENYYNGLPYTPGFTETREYELFQAYLADHKNYVPYRTEWTVYTKKHRLAGSIDMVYIDPKQPGKFILADWKRSKEIKFENRWETGLGPLSDIDNCNYWHYTLQLNVYRMILEKYYGLEISEMFLVVLHPNFDTYKKYDVQRVSKPIMKMLSAK